jgi:nicotinamidase-related amidase
MGPVGHEGSPGVRLTPYSGGGLGGTVGLGARPAVIVVDLITGFTDPGYPTGTGLDAVVANTRTLLDQARGLGLPVLFTTIAFAPDGVEGRVWRQKMPALECLAEGSDAVRVDQRLGRLPAEPVVVKRAASAFGGTGLSATLVGLGADSLVVAGASTSGCVRATVVDACMAGYPTVVPVECVGDRHPGAHEANLFDLQAKYADVRTLAEASRLLETATRRTAGSAARVTVP